ncbi:MAG: MFS transporter [Deltaproteobacteria bacterium]|nr:MFS transporter [Deltaproteobacteria bacterium]
MEASDPARIARVSASVHALIHANMLLLPALVPLLAARFRVEPILVDTAGTAHYLAFGFGAIPAGFLADRFGSRKILLACLAGSAVSATACALAPTLGVFTVALIGLGASASLYHPAGLSLISRSTPSGSLGRALGIHGVGGNLGEALAPAVAALLAMRFDERAPFLAAAAFALMVMVPVARVPSVPSPRGEAEPGGRGVLVSRTLILVLATAVAAGFIYRGATYFLPRHLSAHVDPNRLAWLRGSASWLASGKAGDSLGAVMTSLALLAGVISQWLGGRLADRFQRERLYAVIAAAMFPALLLIAVLDGLSLLMATIVFGFGWYLGQPLLSSIAAGLVPREKHGALYGLQFTASFGLGALAVSACAHVSTRWGTKGAFLALAMVAVASALLGVALVSERKRIGRT